MTCRNCLVCADGDADGERGVGHFYTGTVLECSIWSYLCRELNDALVGNIECR